MPPEAAHVLRVGELWIGPECPRHVVEAHRFDFLTGDDDPSFVNLAALLFPIFVDPESDYGRDQGDLSVFHREVSGVFLYLTA